MTTNALPGKEGLRQGFEHSPFSKVARFHFIFFLPFNNLDDSNLFLALYKLQYGPVYFNPDRFSRLHCNPIFCYSSSNISLTQLNNLDPDTNVNHTGEIAYDCFIENQFNEILTNENYSGAFFFCILIPAVFQTILTTGLIY